MKSKYLHQVSYDIKQVMPANGWQCFSAWKDRDGTIKFDSVPVVGWGLCIAHRTVSTLTPDDRYGPPSEEEIDDTSELKLLIQFEWGMDWATPVDYVYKDSSQAVAGVYPPNTKLEEVKDDLSAMFRTKTEELRDEEVGARRARD